MNIKNGNNLFLLLLHLCDSQDEGRLKRYKTCMSLHHMFELLLLALDNTFFIFKALLYHQHHEHADLYAHNTMRSGKN